MQDRNELNQTALNLPEPGDYWHERFCPFFLVVAADPAQDQYTVLSCISEPNARIDNPDNSWEFDYSRHQTVDQAWIRERVAYSSIPGFVADVVRGCDNIVREWKQFHAQRLMKELKALGPEAFESYYKQSDDIV